MSEQTDVYTAWHDRLGHHEYRVTVTMAGYGTDAEAADAFLDAFVCIHAESGPVVSQDPGADTIAITFALQASSSQHAHALSEPLFMSGGSASGLEPGVIERVEIEPVADAQQESGTHPAAALEPA